MSRYVTLVLTGAASLALGTVAVPAGHTADADSTSVVEIAAKQAQKDGRIGSWCC